MISMDNAKQIVRRNIPGCVIKGIIFYDGKYIILAENNDPLEGDMDPFYSVDSRTGLFGGFSVVHPRNIKVLQVFAERFGGAHV